MDTISILKSDPDSFDASKLQDELSDILFKRFGGDGRNSFQDWVKNDSRYVFIVINKNNEAVGCGAIRPISNNIAELKRMYTKYQRQGIGEKVLLALEHEAQNIGYKKIWLETRVANSEACSFYIKNGYKKIENFGKYKGRENAICFEKILQQTAIQIKRTNSQDVDFKYLISSLDNELSDTYGGKQKKYDGFNIIEKNDTVVLAYQNDIPLGCGCIRKYNNDTMEIKRMFVSKDFRGKGVSKLILKELESWAIEKGYYKAILETGIYQKNAIELYSKHGYEQTENYGQYSNIQTSICMIKNLIE
jgi:GNAT superfamily N-acetyltransferase